MSVVKNTLLILATLGSVVLVIALLAAVAFATLRSHRGATDANEIVAPRSQPPVPTHP